MSTQDSKILNLVADYKINLIEPAAMGEDDLDKFHSNLRSVLGFIKYSDDCEKLSAFLARESGLKALDVEAAKVIKACTNTNIPINKKEKVINVCKAVQEMNDMARQEGREEERIQSATRMLGAGKFQTEEIAQYSGLTVEQIRELAENLQLV